MPGPYTLDEVALTPALESNEVTSAVDSTAYVMGLYFQVTQPGLTLEAFRLYVPDARAADAWALWENTSTTAGNVVASGPTPAIPANTWTSIPVDYELVPNQEYTIAFVKRSNNGYYAAEGFHGDTFIDGPLTVFSGNAKFYPSSVDPTNNLPGGSFGSTNYGINVVVNEPSTVPTLDRTPSSLAFVMEPDTTDSDIFTVSASDASGASVSVSDDAAWLTVSPGSGAEPQDFTASVDTTSLAVGQYTATITATASGYDPITIPVTLTVANQNPVSSENALAGSPTAIEPPVGNGVVGYLGYSKQYSVNVGETIDFAVDGVDAAEIDVYRIGHYGGTGKRLITTLTNTGTNQATGSVVADSNGGTDMAWATTASWAIPANTVSGMFLGVVKATNGTPQAWIPFIVRDDTRPVDVVVMTSDSTWGAAYNYFGDVGSEKTGKSVYGSGGALGNITDRTHFVSYNRPIVTRGTVVNHWDAQELALIDWLEENGYNVRYIGSYDLDQNRIGDASIFISVGHDEYYSQGMRDNLEAFRDAGGHVLFMAGNHIFWRIRWAPDGRGFWCYKDTMPGPGAHVAGDPLDPVLWTGTWKDTRRPDPPGPEHEYTTTGDSFRMNGINNLTMTVDAATYGTSPFWRNTTVEAGTNLVVPEVIGFEANQYMPPDSGAVRLAQTIHDISGSVAGPNGEFYNGAGALDWSPVMFLATPTSGVTVGFGTTQWQWGLSNRHTRGSGTVANLAMRQATTNLFIDLGSVPAAPQSDLVVPSPVALSTYGVTHTGVDPQTPVEESSGSIWYPNPVLQTNNVDPDDYILVTQFEVSAVGTIDRIYYWKESAGDFAPVTLSLVDFTNELVLGSVAVDWATETGWVFGDLAAPINVQPGIAYGACIAINGADGYSFMTGQQYPLTNGALTAFGIAYVQTSADVAVAGFTSGHSTGVYHIDVRFNAPSVATSNLRIGASTVQAAYAGATPVSRLYLGNNLIFETN
jgi:hypothetical protein